MKRFSITEADNDLRGPNWKQRGDEPHSYGQEKERTMLHGAQITRKKAGKTN